jgi:hypothetical protein
MARNDLLGAYSNSGLQSPMIFLIFLCAGERGSCRIIRIGMGI